MCSKCSDIWTKSHDRLFSKAKLFRNSGFLITFAAYEKKKDEIYLGDGWPVGAVARQL